MPRNEAVVAGEAVGPKSAARAFRVAWFALVLLGLYTAACCVFPNMEARTSYRILVISTVVACLLFIHYVKPVLGASAAKGEHDEQALIARRRMEAGICSAVLALLVVFVFLTFPFPALMDLVSIKILSMSVILVCIITAFALEMTIRKEKRIWHVAERSATSGGLVRRFYVSLAVFVLLPVYVVLAYLNPGLERFVEVRVLVLGIAGAALIGFWSVRAEILEFRRILQEARAIASNKGHERLATDREGEVREMADTFNTVLVELDEKKRELERAKQRVSSLVAGVGAAISSAGKAHDLQRLVLQTCADAFGAKRGFLYLSGAGGEETRLEVVSHEDEPPTAVPADIQAKIEVVARTAQPFEERHFVALPLVCGQHALGALALERRVGAPAFNAKERDQLQIVADQAAIGVEAGQRRQSEDRVVFETISALALAVESRDPYTRGHSQRVTAYATAIARELGFTPDDIETVRQSGLLHDIGRIGIPDTLLKKTEPLTVTEHDVTRQHAVTGELILRSP